MSYPSCQPSEFIKSYDTAAGSPSQTLTSWDSGVPHFWYRGKAFLQKPPAHPLVSSFLGSALPHTSVVHSLARPTVQWLVNGAWARPLPKRTPVKTAGNSLLDFQDTRPSTVYTGFCIHSCFRFIWCLGFHQCHVIFTFPQIEQFYFLLLLYCYITGIVWALLKGQRFKVLKDNFT